MTEKQLTPSFRETAQVRLLKAKKVMPDGKTFYNLYIQVNDGNPIAIGLRFPEKDWKKKNLLLAAAMPCEIKTTTIVREPAAGTEDF